MDPIAYLRQHAARFREEWKDFLRIPSISAQRTYTEEIRRAAEWLALRLERAGLRAAVEPTAGHPVVVGVWDGARAGPTVLVYGHYDVQPPEPLEEWTSPPFEPTEHEDRMVARGAVDDKGQLFVHLMALEALLATRRALPGRVVVVAEGEEEIGSPNLEPVLLAHRDDWRPDVVLISDTSMIAPGWPSITVGLRGLVYLEVRVRGPQTDLHSGIYGGAVVNPANALARMLAALVDENGRITIPGFYDRVRELSPAERRALAELPFDEETFRREIGAPALGGEAGYTTLERRWVRPSLDINGLLSGYTGEGAKTVLPAHAMAKLSMRLVPDQDYRDIQERAIDYLRSLAPTGVEVDVAPLHGGNPWAVSPEGPYFAAAERALARAFGRPPVYVREGGSIPIVEVFHRLFGCPILLIGFGLPGENAHAPNEWMSLENFHRGAEAIAAFYEELPRALEEA